MAKIIRIKCNGPGQHINDVDLEKLLQPTTVIKSFMFGRPRLQSSDMPERLVHPCKLCTIGKVVISREVIEDFLRSYQP